MQDKTESRRFLAILKEVIVRKFTASGSSSFKVRVRKLGVHTAWITCVLRGIIYTDQFFFCMQTLCQVLHSRSPVSYPKELPSVNILNGLCLLNLSSRCLAQGSYNVLLQTLGLSRTRPAVDNLSVASDEKLLKVPLYARQS